MTAFVFLDILLLTISLVYFYVTAYRDALSNPVTYFLIFQLINHFGSVSYLEYTNPVDQLYYFCFFFGLLSSIFGFIVGNYFFPITGQDVLGHRMKKLEIEHGLVYDFGFLFLALFSTLVCIAYFRAVGQNIFLMGVANMLSGGPDPNTEDFGTMRLKAYNSAITGDYYYPGFVNQFKDTLFPLSMFYLWSKYLLSKNFRYPVFLLLILSLVSLVSIMGTGQRGAFVIALLVGGGFMITVLNKKHKRIFSFIVGIPALVLFMISTFINGRTGSGEFDIGEVFKAIWERIASDNQSSAAIGFREVMYPRGIQWGSEWWEGIQGFSPWHSGSYLANEIAAFLWISDYGNAPPSNWGSTYYNFGFYGIFLYPFLTAIIVKYFYRRFYTGPKRLFRIQSYIFMFILYGAWISGAPAEFYVNVGCVTVFLLRKLLDFFVSIFGIKINSVQVAFNDKLARSHLLPNVQGQLGQR